MGKAEKITFIVIISLFIGGVMAYVTGCICVAAIKITDMESVKTIMIIAGAIFTAIGGYLTADNI